MLTTTLVCEQKGLGYPKAALFGFCVTLLAYNVLASVKAALRSVHGSAKVEEEVSLPKVAEHVCRNYEGMMVGLPAVEWLRFRQSECGGAGGVSAAVGGEGVPGESAQGQEQAPEEGRAEAGA